MPVFSGISSASQASSGPGIAMSWQQASDDLTAPSMIRYFFFKGWNAATVDWDNPFYDQIGGLSYTHTGFPQGELFSLGIRAEDEAGNRDGNTYSIQARSGYATPPPFAHYPFEGTLFDAGPNMMHLSGSGGVPPVNMADRFNVGGRAAEFTAGTDIVSGTGGTLMENTKMTVALWVYVASTQTEEKVLVAYGQEGNSTPIWQLSIDASGVLRFRGWDIWGTLLKMVYGPPIAADGQTHHIAVTWDSTQIGISVNGSTPAWSTWPSLGYPTGTRRLAVGSWGGLMKVDGIIYDDLKIWTQMLSESELTLLYSSEKP